MSDLNRWEMHGRVRTLRKEFAEWNPDRGEWQPPRGLTIVTFRPDGQLSESEYHNPDRSVARQVRVYDDCGRLTEDQWWTGDVLTNRVLHSYDMAGRPVSATAIGADGTEREVESCRYDDLGRKTKVVFLSVPDASAGSCSPTGCGTFYGVEGTETAYGAPGATTNTIIYDDRELPLQASFHDADQTPVRRIVFSRDRDGRLLNEVVQFEGAGTLFGSAIEMDNLPAEERAPFAELMTAAFGDRTFFLATYAYDEKGRLIERVRRMGQLSEERATFQSDDYGNPVEEVSEDLGRDVRIADGAVKIEESASRIQHSRFEYEYDAHGNWTERMVWQRIGPGSDYRRSNIEHRTITYYGQ